MSSSDCNGFVYAMRAASTGAVKFGWTKDIEARRSQIQTGNHEQVDVVAFSSLPREYERKIHSKLRWANTTGEWFAACREVNQVIDAIASCDAEAIDKMPGRSLPVGLSLVVPAMLRKAPLTKREQQIFWFLVEHTGYKNELQVSLGAIAEEVGLHKPHACSAIKSLIERGIVIERRHRMTPNVPAYQINPEYLYFGSEDSRAVDRRKYNRDSSEAKRPKLTVVANNGAAKKRP